MADSPQIDYSAVLADLTEKRERLDAAIVGIETMLGLQATLSSTSTLVGNLSVGGDMGPGAFLGMKIVDAVVKLLASRRQALRTDEIVSELKRGGIAFSTDAPINTVGSVLNREFKSGGDVVSVGRGQWALAEWHPRLKKRPPIGTVVAKTDEIGEEMLSKPPDSVAETQPPKQEPEPPPKPRKTDPDFDDDIPF